LHQGVDAQQVIYAMGNPILWWGFVPALVWVVVRYARRRDPADGAILCGFCGFWLPWVFVDRVAFAQYLLPAVPFGVLAIASSLDDLRAALGRRGRWVPLVYLAASFAVFVNFYPFWSAAPIPNKDFFQSHRYYWFDKWRKN
jgi:dolichyl-phosphate-mannose--protein O-mannosyl transferase